MFSLAADHPVLRPRSRETVQRVAGELPPGGHRIPRPVVEEVLASLSIDDITWLVTLAEECNPARWRALVDDVGVELAREPLLAGIATAAVEELVPPPRWLVATREGTSNDAPGPVDVLATLVPPQSVWSSDECGAAFVSYKRCGLPHGLAVVRAFAQSQISEWRLDRARHVARPVGRLLPVAEAPRTSTQLWEALELVQEQRGGALLCERLLFGAVARLDGLVPTAPSPN